jgi:uncharacterized membrane protein
LPIVAGGKESQTGRTDFRGACQGALIGVLISVTTIPAAANIGVAVAFADWREWRGAVAQLLVNLSAIVFAGVLTLFVQRRVYMRRRQRHLGAESREIAGLPSERPRVEAG